MAVRPRASFEFFSLDSALVVEPWGSILCVHLDSTLGFASMLSVPSGV